MSIALPLSKLIALAFKEAQSDLLLSIVSGCLKTPV